MSGTRIGGPNEWRQVTVQEFSYHWHGPEQSTAVAHKNEDFQQHLLTAGPDEQGKGELRLKTDLVITDNKFLKLHHSGIPCKWFYSWT